LSLKLGRTSKQPMSVGEAAEEYWRYFMSRYFCAVPNLFSFLLNYN
jgi:hypothetical protein